jgi:hypothetical protein
MVHNSLEAERGFDKAIKEGSTTFDRKRGNPADRHQEKLKPKVTPWKGRQTNVPKTFLICKKCGKAHLGECRMGSDTCFACHVQAGNFVANCPYGKNKGKSVDTTMSKGRVYSLDGKKARVNEDLIGGMCYLG